MTLLETTYTNTKTSSFKATWHTHKDDTSNRTRGKAEASPFKSKDSDPTMKTHKDREHNTNGELLRNLSITDEKRYTTERST